MLKRREAHLRNCEAVKASFLADFGARSFGRLLFPTSLIFRTQFVPDYGALWAEFFSLFEVPVLSIRRSNKHHLRVHSMAQSTNIPIYLAGD